MLPTRSENEVNREGGIEQVTLTEFLNTEMQGKFILSLMLPALSTDYIIKTYKIMPRAGNAHAYINAGFCARIPARESTRIDGKPTIVFGGIRPSLVCYIPLVFCLHNYRPNSNQKWVQILSLLDSC